MSIFSDLPSTVTYSNTSPIDHGAWDYYGTYFTPETDAITAFPVFGRIKDIPDEVEFVAFDWHLSYQQIAAIKSGDLRIMMTFTTSTSDPFDTHDIHVTASTFSRVSGSTMVNLLVPCFPEARSPISP